MENVEQEKNLVSGCPKILNTVQIFKSVGEKTRNSNYDILKTDDRSEPVSFFNFEL